MEDTTERLAEQTGSGRENEPSAKEQVEKIVEAAAKLGIEVDETDTTQWLTAMAASDSASGDLAVDAHAGVFGHRVTLLDFAPEVLARYRRMAEIVEIPDRPGVETAIALSGSAAQSRIQLFPADADFFERVNVQAPTREEACRLLGRTLREKALDRLKGSTYELVRVRWGTWQEAVVRGGITIGKGGSIVWGVPEVQQGYIEVATVSGEPLTIPWEYGEREPGWCKLDWVIVEPDEGLVVHASNMLDVTWEAPMGEVVPLDGFLDPYFQEVYLDADSIPLFSKLVKRLSPDALQQYVAALEREVVKYSQKEPKNLGKVARRMYNIFRLTGRWSEAAYIRELFDEPAAVLYQVGALMDTIDEAASTAMSIDREPLIDQVDRLIRTVVRVCEGQAEEKIVDALLRLRDDLAGRRELGEARQQLLTESYRLVGELVNEFFRTRLFLRPEILVYLDSLTAS